jgi:hypothetical protein
VQGLSNLHLLNNYYYTNSNSNNNCNFALQHMWDMFTKAAALAPRVHTIANAEAEAEAAAPAFGGNAREPPRGFGEGFGGGFFGAAQ